MGNLQVKAGDKVIVVSSGWYCDDKIATVEKITPTGLIKVCGTLYYANGMERGGNSWSCSHLEEYTEEKGKKIRENLLISETCDKLRNIKELSYEQAVAINKILESEVSTVKDFGK